MLANIIYVVVAIILIFVLYLAVKAITRGVEAKSELSKEKNESDINEITNDLSIEISRLKKMFPILVNIKFSSLSNFKIICKKPYLMKSI